MSPKPTYIEFKDPKKSQSGKPHLPFNRQTQPLYPQQSIPLAQYTNLRAYNPGGVIGEKDLAGRILSEPILIVERLIQPYELAVGFEECNRYIVKNYRGEKLAMIEEHSGGFKKMLVRQVAKSKRPFTFDVIDNDGNVVLTFKRKFEFITSHLKACLPNDTLIGESFEKYNVIKRKYNLFQVTGPNQLTQFGYVNAPPKSFEFSVGDEQGQTIAAVDCNWTGLAREVFTNSNMYIIRMDPWAFQGVADFYKNVKQVPLTLDQRAILLANVVSLDFDYFTRDHDSN